jgi:hypothetical protein
MTGVGTDTLLREWGALLEDDHFVYLSRAPSYAEAASSPLPDRHDGLAGLRIIRAEQFRRMPVHGSLNRAAHGRRVDDCVIDRLRRGR